MLKKSNKSQRRGTRFHSDADLRHMREKALHREIKKQEQKQREIENRRKNRKLIFWSIAIFGIVVITAITGVFLSLLGLVEWQVKIENTRTRTTRKRWLRPDIDYHFVETCAPYKIWDEHGMKYMVYTVRYVLGPKPDITKKRRT